MHAAAFLCAVFTSHEKNTRTFLSRNGELPNDVCCPAPASGVSEVPAALEPEEEQQEAAVIKCSFQGLWLRFRV